MFVSVLLSVTGKQSEAELTALIVERLEGVPPGAVVLTELGGVAGRPDITVLGPMDIAGPVDGATLGRLLSLPSIAQLVAALGAGDRTVDELQERFDYSRPHLRRQLREGLKCGLFEWLGDRVHLTMPLNVDTARMVSYEVKLSDWRRALHQCLNYKLYSHEVRLIMPTRQIRNVLQQEHVIRNCGFGLMAAASDGTTETVIEPDGFGPNAPRYYLQALGHALKRLHDVPD